MKIVDRKTFMELPVGTLCAEGEPAVFGDLFFKGETLRRDNGVPFDYLRIGLYAFDHSQWDDMFENGTSRYFNTAESHIRDACFELDAHYLVFEKYDLECLKDLIEKAIEKDRHTNDTV